MITVGICDDDALVLSYLTSTLSRVDDIAVVHQCAGGREALAASPVDIWLMDIRMPGISGVQACRSLTSRPNPPRVLLLTSLSTTTLPEAIAAGASGFLYKDTPGKALAAAIRTAHSGIFVHSPDAARALTTRVTSREPAPDGVLRDAVDHELIRAINAGRSYDQMAEALGMSVSGVKKRVGILMKRAGVTSRPQLMAQSASWGISPVPGTAHTSKDH
ncbi:response regulator transcription factor [Tessaracoccus lapidicaptus]|uniref:response regulator transcription factor n=1 Tax=Tessaracoccus lapidicaptus TaxID=1427523 RepID=UPI0033412D85